MIVWYYVLDLYHYKDRNYLLLFPFIMIVWVNLHGGFMGGFMLIGIYLFGNFVGYLFPKGDEKEVSLKRFKILALTTIACLAVSLVNPYGFHILLFPFKLTSAKYLMDHVSEFLSPNFHASYAKSFEFLLLFTITLLGRSKLRLNIIETVLLLLFTHMSLYSARYIPLFAIIAAPILARQLQTIEEQSSGKFAGFMRKRASNIAAIDASATGYFWPLASVILVISLASIGTVEFKFDEKIKPVAAVEFLKKEKISGHMFNNDEFGDYIIYSAYPHYKVYIDGRLDMYGAKNVKEYRKITNFEQGWEIILDKYNISWIIYDADSALSRFLFIHKDWKLIYADKVANIFVKNIAANQYLIDKYRTVKPVVIEDKEDAAK
jgi:nitrate reductase NapE component